MHRIRIRVTVGVTDGVYVVWCEKSTVKKVLVLVLAIVFTGIVNNPEILLLASLLSCTTVTGSSCLFVL